MHNQHHNIMNIRTLDLSPYTLLTHSPRCHRPSNFTILIPSLPPIGEAKTENSNIIGKQKEREKSILQGEKKRAQNADDGFKKKTPFFRQTIKNK